ncbi:MAG TPA: hypothetical protein PLF71_02305 [bacterium]|nr:MAG: hypothetical protein BWY14_00696 [Parcubacteria group bacterium ADurb.Bin192]HPN14924.1 hypothetical protein [bacterium]
MRRSSWVIVIISAILAGVYESGFIGSAPSVFAYIRPVVPVGVLFLLLNKRPAAYTLAVIAGLIIDLMSATSAGFVTGRWLLVFLLVDLLASRVTTNRSLYASMALVAAARLLDRTLWQLLSWFGTYVLNGAYYLEPWSRLLGVFVFDIIFTTLVFVSITLFTKRFVISVNAYKGRYE